MTPLKTQMRWLLLCPLHSLCILLTSGEIGAAAQADSDRVTVYYFHSTYRCESCLFIEGIAETTLRVEFPHELSEGKVVWRPLNMRLAENSHFITEFGLEANELVVVREKGGKV